MKRSPIRRLHLLALLWMSLISSAAFSQNLSGREFWFTFPVVGSTVPGEGPNFFIISDYCIDTGYIEIPGLNYKTTFSVAPGQYTQVTLPQTVAGQPFHHSVSNAKQSKGIRITTPFPVTVYAVTYERASVDGETVIPSTLLGNEYVGAMRGNLARGSARLTVVATENATKVTVNYWNAAGAPRKDTITLNMGETYQVSSTRNVCAAEFGSACAASDGMNVLADKPVAVVNSIDCANGNECGACDNLMSMPLPVEKWGTRYALAQTIPRVNPALGASCLPSNANSGDWYHIIGKVGTIVTINQLGITRNDTIKNFSWNNNANYGYGGIWGQNPVGSGTGNSNFGNCDMVINATQPIQVMQYSKGWQTDNQNFTDPEAMVIFPESMWESSYLIGSLKVNTSTNGYLVLVVNDVGAPLPSTTILQNGTNVGATGWVPIGNSTWKYKRITLIPSSTTQRLQSTGNYKFGVYSASSGAAESFAFQGGLGPILQATCPTCPIASFTAPKGVCTGQTVTFTDISKDNDATGTSRIVKWVWKYGDGTSDTLTTRTNPTHIYYTSGTYTVTLEATNNSTPVCTQEFTFKINVGKGPTVKAGPDATLCRGEQVRLGAFPVISGGARPYTVAWTPTTGLSSSSDTMPVAKPTSTTAYILTVTDSLKCVGKDTVNITVLDRDSVYLTASGTICVGDVYQFTVNINASGSQTYTLKVSDGTAVKTFTGLKNGDKITVNPTGTSDYFITDFFRDDNALACYKFSTALLKVTVKPLPTASWDAGGSICVGSSFTLKVNLPSAGPYTFSYTDGTTVTTKSNINQSPFSQVVNPSTTTTYTLTNIEYSNSPKCSVNPDVKVTVQVVNKANPGLGDTITLCRKAAAVDLNTLLTNNPQAGTWTDQSSSGILNGSVVNPAQNSGLGLGNYLYAYTVKGTSPCPDSSTNVLVTIVGPPSFVNVSDKSNCDANLNSYKVNAEVVGGDPATYSSPDGTITQVGSIYKFTGTITYPTKSNYLISVDDANNCGPSTFTGYVNCGCSTSAGKMSGITKNACETATITVPVPTQSSLLGKDTLIYILHEGNSSVIVNELARSATPSFTFLPGMTTGRTYYISSVAGPKTATGPDFSSDCISIAQGTPVVWHQLPTVAFGRDQNICSSTPGYLSFTFTGSSPFGAYLDNSYYRNLNSNDSIMKSPTVTTTYTLDSIFDKYCSVAVNVPTATITVNNVATLVSGSETTNCNNTASGYTYEFNITGGDSSSYRIISGGGQFIGSRYYSPVIPNGTAFSVAIDDKNNCGPLNISNTYTCPCITAIGSLSTSTANVCEGDSARVNPVTYTADVDDVIKYILHPNSADPFDQPITIQDGTVFGKVAGMSFGTTYYISAVIGNKLANGNPDVNERCYQKSNPVSTVFRENPDASISGPAAICAGYAGTFTVEYTENTVAASPVTVGPANYNISVSPTSTTTYELTKITNTATGCFRNISSSHTITVNALPTLSFSAADSDICERDVARLNFTFTGREPFNVSYTTPNGTSSQVVNTTTLDVVVPAKVGTNVYKITSFSDNNCVAPITDSVVIIKRANPLGGTVTPAEICDKERLVIGFKFTTGTGPFDVQYRMNNVQQANLNGLANNDTTSTFGYKLGVNNFALTSITDQSTGCTSTSQGSSKTTVHALPSGGLTTTKDMCEGDSVELSVDLNGVPPMSFTYSNDLTPPQSGSVQGLPTGTSTFFVKPAAAGLITYTVNTITDAHCSSTGSSQAFITAKPAPLVDYNLKNFDGCVPLSVDFENFSTSTEAFSCVWKIADMAPITNCADFNYVFTEVGSYPVTLQVTSATGCVTTKTGAVVEVRPIPAAAFEYTPDHPTMSNNLVSFINRSTFGDTYFWSFDTLATSTKQNPAYLFPDQDEATYLIKLVTTSEYGCIDSTEQKLKISGEMITFIPNSFTPNGDGVNDVFLPVIAGNASDFKAYELAIFNRWGEMLFFSKEINVGWNGLFEGNKVQNDVYIYRIRVRSKYDAEAKEFLGKIGVIR